ncbi:Glycerol uptake facilitator protein [Mycoplasma yeatsii 13926]|uniref:Glycerol uptake facilitator protein n=1 Tax=Mycoplasma yeatsii 13926 TaxID=1188240 RepID=S6G6R6_9MOLU|nr:MIP/aquaporin family protein [Mycoplasma yeatsii]EOA06988.1 Glycerol uptake facilitator protein [Mycoplasma yeatsii 13926]
MTSQSVILTELFGTMLLIILGNGIVANVVLKGTKGQNAGWISITAGWGFAVFVAAMISSALKGVAHLNPAVTIMSAISSKSWGFADVAGFSGAGLFFVVLIVQLIGAMLGQIVVDVLHLNHIKLTKQDEDFQTRFLAIHSTGATQKSISLNFLMEFVGTAVLLFAIIGVGKTAFSSYGPLAVGLAVFSIGLSLGGTTGYAINPARDLGPRIVHALLPCKEKGSSDWKYSWIPVAGPISAAVVVGLIGMAL